MSFLERISRVGLNYECNRNNDDDDDDKDNDCGMIAKLVDSLDDSRCIWVGRCVCAKDMYI